jgi:hypothetical protein
MMEGGMGAEGNVIADMFVIAVRVGNTITSLRNFAECPVLKSEVTRAVDTVPKSISNNN